MAAEKVSDVVRRLRTEAGWEQFRLAKAAGIALRTLTRLESGTPVNATTRQAIARALRIPGGALEGSLLEGGAGVALEIHASIAPIRNGKDFFEVLTSADSLAADADDTDDEGLAFTVASLLDQIDLARQWKQQTFGARYTHQRAASALIRALARQEWEVRAVRIDYLDTGQQSATLCVQNAQAMRLLERAHRSFDEDFGHLAVERWFDNSDWYPARQCFDDIAALSKGVRKLGIEGKYFVRGEMDDQTQELAEASGLTTERLRYLLKEMKPANEEEDDLE